MAMRLQGKRPRSSVAAVSGLQRLVCSRPKTPSVPADHSLSKLLIGGEALVKTAVGFSAATFAQQFNQFRPEYGPHFRDIYRHMRVHCPVAHTDEAGGFWVLTRYTDI